MYVSYIKFTIINILPSYKDSFMCNTNIYTQSNVNTHTHTQVQKVHDYLPHGNPYVDTLCQKIAILDAIYKSEHKKRAHTAQTNKQTNKQTHKPFVTNKQT